MRKPIRKASSKVDRTSSIRRGHRNLKANLLEVLYNAKLESGLRTKAIAVHAQRSPGKFSTLRKDFPLRKTTMA